jgi:large subunit ribosomal protein L6
MSRVAKNPISIPKGVSCTIDGRILSVKNGNASAEHSIHELVTVTQEDSFLKITVKDNSTLANAVSGSTRAVLHNMITGVTKGFTKELNLLGVGYRASVEGNKLNLTLGFSHPVVFPIPKGISIETPSQTEVIVKGADKQLVGKVSSEIRAFRPPEPYKGKGVRYKDEQIIIKETKKK